MNGSALRGARLAIPAVAGCLLLAGCGDEEPQPTPPPAVTSPAQTTTAEPTDGRGIVEGDRETPRPEPLDVEPSDTEPDRPGGREDDGRDSGDGGDRRKDGGAEQAPEDPVGANDGRSPQEAFEDFCDENPKACS